MVPSSDRKHFTVRVREPTSAWFCERTATPQKRQLVIIEPIADFDLDREAQVGLARGVQWWTPRTPLACKVVNKTKAPRRICKDIVVAKVIALNTSDRERMQTLLAPVPLESIPAWSAGGRVDKASHPTQQPMEEKGSARVDLADANSG